MSATQPQRRPNFATSAAEVERAAKDRLALHRSRTTATATAVIKTVKVAGRYRIERDGVIIGYAWGNGARKTYGRSWTYTVLGGAERRTNTLHAAREIIVREAK